MASNIDATKPADGTPASKADLRANLAAAKAEIEALQTGQAAQSAFGSGTRNRILNGGFRVDRRALGTTSILASTKAFVQDRWQVGSEVAGGAGLSATTISGPFNRTALQVTVSTPKVTLGATDRHWIAQTLEAATMFDMQFGYSTVQSLVLSFYVKTSVPGTFAVALQNSGFSRSRIATFSVPIANVWTYISVQFPGDTSGTWTTNTTTFWTLRFDLGTGSTYQGGNTVWIGSDVRTTASAVSIVGTGSATYCLSDVQLEVGTTASTFERRPDTLEQLLTARYYETGQINFAGYQTAGGTIQNFVRAQVDKRAVPTITPTGAPTNVTTPAYTPVVSGFLANGTATATGSWVWTSTYVMDAELPL